MKASVRAQGIKGIGKGKGGLGASEDHGKRLDETSKRRIVSDRNSLNWSKAGEDKGLDLVEAFKAHKKEFGAKERNNCEIGTHLLVTVSPEWLAEVGSVHDKNNPRILRLIEEAKIWAESWQGEGSVYAWRFDLDEKGSGVVDLFTAPVREQGRRGGKKVTTIAPSQAKDELTKSTGEKTSGAAFQTSWAEWAQKRLDPRFERGKRKKDTGREHIHAEIYAQEAERARKDAQRDAEKLRERIMAEERARAIEEARIANSDAIQTVLNEARNEAEKIKREATPRKIAELQDELKNTKALLKQFQVMFELVKSKLKSLFPSHYDDVAKAVNSEWNDHPDNPNRKPREESCSFSPSP